MRTLFLERKNYTFNKEITMQKRSFLSLYILVFLALSCSVPSLNACTKCAGKTHVSTKQNDDSFDIEALQALADDAYVVVAPPRVPSRVEKVLRKIGVPIAAKLVACKSHLIKTYKRIRYGN